MKKIFSLFSLALLFCHLSIAQSYQSARKRALEILQQYDPGAYAMIISYEKSPSKFRAGDFGVDLGEPADFMQYMDGYKEEDLIDGMGTAVHEISHGYTFRMHYAYRQKLGQLHDFKNTFSLIYQNPRQQTLIKHTKTFPAREMIDAIPSQMRTSRFSTYISEAPDEQSTQQSGIYGLLDEWNAYFLDTKVAFNLHNYYLNESKKQAKDWLEFMSGVDAVLYAHMEFKYYVLKYLIYARQKHPDVYRQIIQNQGFKIAFRNVNRDFSELIKKYFKLRKELLDSIKAKGQRVSFDDEYTFIGSSGIGNFMKTYNLIAEELNQEVYQNMLKILQS